MTATGEIVFSTDKSIEGQSRSTSKFFTQGWNGPIVQNVYPSPVTSKPTITVASPLFGVFSSEGKRLGVAAAHVRLSKLDDIVDSRTGLSETGEAYLINHSNLFISKDGFGTPEFPEGVHSAAIDAAVKKGKGIGIYRNYTNTTVVGVYRWMPKLGLALLVEMHVGEALAPARQLGLMIIGVGLPAVLLLVTGVYLYARRVINIPEGDIKIGFAEYDLGRFYDEMTDSNGRPRAGSALLSEFVENLPAGQLVRRQKAADQAFTRLGINFNVYGDESGVDRIWPFDIVPRIVEPSDWAYLERGLKQRIHVLNTFINDIYHDQKIVKDGVVPDHMIQSARNLLPACMGLNPPKGLWCHITGTDLVRDGTGKMFVLEDNLRCPSGVSYVIQNRQVLKGTFPEVFEASRVRPVDDYPSHLLETLRYLAPEGTSTPVIVLLTPGIYNSAYFEHAFLAQQMGIELVEGRDLIVTDGHVMMRTTQGMQRVDVIYRRIDDDFLDPLVFRSDSQLGVPGLMGVFREGGVALANAPGTGIADDKAIYAYVPQMVKYYLSMRKLYCQM